VVDADAEAHALYAPGSELVRDLARRFGSGIVRADGSVDRSALGKLVFSNPASLADLDALVHPLARSRIRTAVEQATRRGEDVALEMALLYRWPEMAASMDRIVGIRCSDPIRLERLAARPGMSLEQARRRMLAQDQDLLLSVADFSITNEGSPSDLEANLEDPRLGQKTA
jgi:dephospho-CoA kinase